MRIMVFFDLNMKEDEELKAYRNFRKFLLKEGFIMYQYSIYIKLVLNAETAKLYRKKIVRNAPTNGMISVLQITEKQFAGMEYVIGGKYNVEDDTDRRLIIL